MPVASVLDTTLPMEIRYCSGYESINARVYVCDNLCTVLGKNAPNGYTEIHQSILNSYTGDTYALTKI